MLLLINAKHQLATNKTVVCTSRLDPPLDPRTGLRPDASWG